MLFNKFMMFYNHYKKSVLEHFHYPTQIPFTVTPCSPQLLAPGEMDNIGSVALGGELFLNSPRPPFPWGQGLSWEEH